VDVSLVAISSSSSLFLFLLYVVKELSSLNDCEKWTIRIEFLNLTREAKTHDMWLLIESHVQLFPFIPVSWIRATVLEYRGPRTMEQSWAMVAIALAMCPWERCEDGGKYVHAPVQSGT
jgi:hypothetical protein